MKSTKTNHELKRIPVDYKLNKQIPIASNPTPKNLTQNPKIAA